MRIWRILYETGDEVYVARETLEEAVECARSQGESPFSQVMEISEVREKCLKPRCAGEAF